MIRDKRNKKASGQPTAGDADHNAGERVQADETTQAGNRAEATMGQPDNPNGNANGGAPVDETPSGTPAASAKETDEIEVVTGEVMAEEPAPRAATKKSTVDAPAGLGAELEALRTELDERLRDLQRVTAEYANYRKRVDRDRAAVVEQATGLVVAALVPILDDLDRAREHGDLVGPAAAMADQLNAALAKFGLTGFGEVGDAFDPTRHEAVAHQTSPDVTEPTCITVMRRGYLLGDRLLRAAMVAVADPE